MQENAQEFYTGFVFEVVANGDNDYDEDYLDTIWGDGESRAMSVVSAQIRDMIAKTRSAKYRTEFAFDYGYVVEMKVDLPEPLQCAGNRDKMLRIGEEVMDYYRREHRIKAVVQKDKSHIVIGELEHWHRYGVYR